MQPFSFKILLLLAVATALAADVDNGSMNGQGSPSQVERSTLPISSRSIGMQRKTIRSNPSLNIIMDEKAAIKRQDEDCPEGVDEDETNTKRSIKMKDILSRIHVRSFIPPYVRREDIEVNDEKKRHLAPLIAAKESLLGGGVGIDKSASLDVHKSIDVGGGAGINEGASGGFYKQGQIQWNNGAPQCWGSNQQWCGCDTIHDYYVDGRQQCWKHAENNWCNC